jgi:hypothetical protein
MATGGGGGAERGFGIGRAAGAADATRAGADRLGAVDRGPGEPARPGIGGGAAVRATGGLALPRGTGMFNTSAQFGHFVFLPAADMGTASFLPHEHDSVMRGESATTVNSAARKLSRG